MIDWQPIEAVISTKHSNTLVIRTFAGIFICATKDKCVGVAESVLFASVLDLKCANCDRRAKCLNGQPEICLSVAAIAQRLPHLSLRKIKWIRKTNNSSSMKAFLNGSRQ